MELRQHERDIRRKEDWDVIIEAFGEGLKDEWIQLLDNKTFQVDIISPTKIRLTPVRMTSDLGRCPVVVGGEQCGCRAGHEGRHMWGSGD